MTEQKPIKANNSTHKNWLTEHWLVIFLVLYGVWVWVPFLAPVFMRMGWENPAKVIYWIYSFFCHQLPDRSYFFFGQRLSYSLSEIQDVWINTTDPLLMRGFIGSSEMGWKVAWSDRMISFYGGFWVFAMVLAPFRKNLKKLSVWGTALFLLPMVIDGVSHIISEFIGYQGGFRFTNLWLGMLTNNQLPVSFYSGNMLGSFNWWMRMITGAIAGLGLSWFILSTVKPNLTEYNPE